MPTSAAADRRTVRAEAVEDVLDVLLPLLPRGVHPGEPARGLVELVADGA